MTAFTTLNIEQSIARFIADQFLAEGYKIYWWDTATTEGTGAITVTLIRDFPESPSTIVHQSLAQQDNYIRVPAFSVGMFIPPRTTKFDRTGLGESVFEWSADVRVDGFADNELQWYKINSLFKEWTHPDIRIQLRDYESDLSVTAPAVEGAMQLENTIPYKTELSGPDLPNAVRYYLGFTASAKYFE